jgi:hypothetical protein
MPSIDAKKIEGLRELAANAISDSMLLGTLSGTPKEVEALGRARNALRALPVLLDEREEIIRERDRFAGIARSMDGIAKTNADLGDIVTEALAQERGTQERMLDVLRTVEWRGWTMDTGRDVCPSCGRAREQGHAADCHLAAFLYPKTSG